MGNNIKGITIEIGGNAQKLKDVLSNVNKDVRGTQTELREVNKLLKLDPTNVEALTQKQKLLGKAIGETKEKLDVLKKAEEIDGYCGVMVSIFIIFTGIKSLWEVLGRIMGKAADIDTKDTILQIVGLHPEIISIRNLMLHDYGFGYFVVSMRAEGYKKDSEQLYIAINQISYELYKKFHCDCFIQIDYLLHDET